MPFLKILWPAIAVIGLGVLVSAPKAQADDTPFTQAGTVLCPTQDGAGNWQCPYVTFPSAFGCIPNVTLTWPIRHGHLPHGWGGNPQPNLVTSNVTGQGFQPSYAPLPGTLTGPISMNWSASGPSMQTAAINPKYLVLTVIYSPPGTKGGSSKSLVSYQDSSSAGSAVSANQSFKIGNTLSIDPKATVLGNGIGSGSEFEYSQSNTDNQALVISKSAAYTITVNGPAQDGVVHDEDQIWLVLMPTVNMYGCASNVNWLLTNTSASHVQYVLVGELNGDIPMRAGVLNELQSVGITPSDYPGMLAQDPLANKSSSFDPSSLDAARFVVLNPPFTYESPAVQGDPVDLSPYTISVGSISTVGSAQEQTFDIGLDTSVTVGIPAYATATLKNSDTWAWTYQSSQSSSSGSSQSASLTLAGPSYGYTGPTVAQVYFDTVYKTFAFAIVPPSAQPESAPFKKTLGTITHKQQHGYVYTIKPQ